MTIKQLHKKYPAYHIEKIKDVYVFFNFFGHEVDSARTLKELEQKIIEYNANPGEYVDKSYKASVN